MIYTQVIWAMLIDGIVWKLTPNIESLFGLGVLISGILVLANSNVEKSRSVDEQM